jgi:hypothetical protein
MNPAKDREMERNRAKCLMRASVTQNRGRGDYFFANERTRVTVFRILSALARSPSAGIWSLPFWMM